jgi:hypothetical protein
MKVGPNHEHYTTRIPSPSEGRQIMICFSPSSPVYGSTANSLNYRSPLTYSPGLPMMSVEAHSERDSTWSPCTSASFICITLGVFGVQRGLNFPSICKTQIRPFFALHQTSEKNRRERSTTEIQYDLDLTCSCDIRGKSFLVRDRMSTYSSCFEGTAYIRSWNSCTLLFHIPITTTTYLNKFAAYHRGPRGTLPCLEPWAGKLRLMVVAQRTCG